MIQNMKHLIRSLNTSHMIHGDANANQTLVELKQRQPKQRRRIPYRRKVEMIPCTPSTAPIVSILPLRLFQTWHTKNMPYFMKKNMNSLIEKHPEFQHTFFDDQDCRDFIVTHFPPSVLEAFDRLIPGAYKADLFRYCVLYIHGGIYIDIKFHTVPEFSLLSLTDKEYFTRDINNIDVYNGLMACLPQNPILMKCINDGSQVIENVFFEFRNPKYGMQLVLGTKRYSSNFDAPKCHSHCLP
jgi:mannosyltransferase OCH1-like enzyme